MRGATRDWTGLLLVASLGLMGLLQYPLADWRPEPPDRRPAEFFTVISAADSGPGTLREAIFRAASTEGPSRIELGVPRIELASPLPPLVNPSGVEIRSGETGCVIDASQVASAPVLELSGGGGRLEDFEITGAQVAAVLIRGSACQIRGMKFTGNEVAVEVLADSVGSVVADSRFDGNRVGVRVDGGGTALAIRGNRFQSHQLAAVWAVQPDSAGRVWSGPIEVSGNRFSGDHTSLVAYDLPVRIVRNQFHDALETALYLAGRGAITENNRIRGGRRFGILLEQPDGTRVGENEIDGNAHVALLIKGGRAAAIRENRIYRNGYGAVVVFGEPLSPHILSGNLILNQLHDGVFVVGSSPVVRDNRLLANQQAGLRVLDFRSRGQNRDASPLITGNVSLDNGLNEVVRGEYRLPKGERE